MAEGPFWVYVLENAAGRFYVGQTDDLGRRLAQHNDPLADPRKYAVKHGLGSWLGLSSIRRAGRRWLGSDRLRP